MPTEEEEETDDSGFYAGTPDLGAVILSLLLSVLHILQLYIHCFLTQGAQYHWLV